MRTWTGKEDREIDQLISNYIAAGKEKTADYGELLAERERRRAKHLLDADKSLEILSAAARERRFVAYGELADASGVKWSNTVRARMSGPKGHLDRLLDICNNRGLPLLPSLCVNKQNVATGKLDDESLAGFVAGAKRLGLKNADKPEFLASCQEACFVWGEPNPRATAA